MTFETEDREFTHTEFFEICEDLHFKFTAKENIARKPPQPTKLFNGVRQGPNPLWAHLRPKTSYSERRPATSSGTCINWTDDGYFTETVRKLIK